MIKRVTNNIYVNTEDVVYVTDVHYQPDPSSNGYFRRSVPVHIGLRNSPIVVIVPGMTAQEVTHILFPPMSVVPPQDTKSKGSY